MIAILKYNAGNATSVKNAVERLGYKCQITAEKSELQAAEKVIFPGVGEASTAMRFLTETGLDEVIKNLTQPVLGICLGQQLLCQHSEENDTTCLGIFDTLVKAFPKKMIVPHMGWNNFTKLQGALFQTIQPQEDVYFVHSFYAEICEQTTAVCDYILPFSAALQRDNFYATQFHPEKSAGVGQRILKSFLEL